MKRLMKNSVAVMLSLVLAIGLVGVKPANAASLKGAVAPITIQSGWGSTNINHWLGGDDAYSTDFSKYSVSADVYFPRAMIDGANDPNVSINTEISFWYEDLQESGKLPMARENEIIVGYNKEANEFWYNGYDEAKKEDVSLSFVKSVTAVGDMVKVEIVDAPVSSKLYSTEWDEVAGKNKDWTKAIPEKGSINAEVRLASGNAFDGKFAVTNVSVKIGDKVVSADYDAKDIVLGDAWGDVQGEIGELKTASFNTSAVAVAKSSVSVKAKKSAAVKVTTMFDGDKVTVSSSSKKVATVTYKKGKVTIKGVKKGKATITVKANGKTKKIKVTVK